MGQDSYAEVNHSFSLIGCDAWHQELTGNSSIATRSCGIVNREIGKTSRILDCAVSPAHGCRLVVKRGK